MLFHHDDDFTILHALPEPVVELRADLTLEQALEILSIERIQSAPVFDHDKEKYTGFGECVVRTH